MSHTYGIMQGRLAPPEDGRFQSFPRKAWREEFARAREAGLDYIEWIHDAYGEAKDPATGRIYNPIFTPEGLAEFDALKAEHNIATTALCGDWFMDVPLIRCSPSERDRREQHLHDLIPIAVEHNIELHLEADFGPEEFAAFLARIEHPSLKVNWDSGNSSGLGYIASDEFAAYGPRIGSVHIKDRYKKPEGGVETRPLGTGSANFDDVFASIKKIDYKGGVTLQVARGADNDEVNFIKTQLDFVKRYW